MDSYGYQVFLWARRRLGSVTPTEAKVLLRCLHYLIATEYETAAAAVC